MRTVRWMLTISLAVVIGMVLAFPIAAQSTKQIKQAQKLLQKLKLVDGPGSGLDADTVQGMTPAQVKDSITPPTPQDTLAALQQVDGAGSGLDADTLQGLSPAQLMGGAGSGGLSVLDSTGRSRRAAGAGAVRLLPLRCFPDQAGLGGSDHRRPAGRPMGRGGRLCGGGFWALLRDQRLYGSLSLLGGRRVS